MLGLFAALYVGLPLLGTGIDRVFRLPAIPEPVRVAGVAPLIVGGLGLAWCFALFVRIGKGTPNPARPPNVLVTNGPYAWTRNPIVLSHALAVLGLGLILGSPGTIVLLLVLAVPVSGVVPTEEQTLETRYGDAYRRYRDAVPRWIPRLRRHSR
jgi:protein-S-isoprenylcysteine O-methyltransferase Ste14